MDILKGVEFLKKGGVIIYPTETLYGLGANALDDSGVRRVFEIKKRPWGKSVPVIIGDISQIEMLVDSSVDIPLELILKHFWPGPLSVLFPAKKGLSRFIVNSKGYVCVRISSHPVARRLCIDSGCPLVATSANISGKPSPKTFEDIDEELIEKVDFVVDLPPEPCGFNPSTIINFVGKNCVEVIREGAVSLEELKKRGLVIKK